VGAMVGVLCHRPSKFWFSVLVVDCRIRVIRSCCNLSLPCPTLSKERDLDVSRDRWASRRSDREMGLEERSSGMRYFSSRACQGAVD
jgi:hypothetical protein